MIQNRDADHLDEFLDLQEAVAGKYSLDHEIARGGMGIVFLARDVTLDRPVAIKLLSPRLAVRSDMRERFLREARISAKLSHPNIVPVHSVEEAGEFVFIVMAYVDGETLAERVRGHGPLKVSDAIHTLREISWALAYAHAQGVVHRDIKPENILLESGSDRALVTDFGIALVADAVTEELGDVLGTPEYMSPEQSSGEEVGDASDIYALGALAYFVLTGKPPFVAERPAEVIAQHIGAPVPTLANPNRPFPPSLKILVERCLAKNPEDRPESGEELAELLGQVTQKTQELPVPLRIFVEREKTSESRRNVRLLAAFAFGPMVLGALGVGLFTGSPIAKTIAGLIVAALVASPVLIPVARLRTLLKAGHGRNELISALHEDAQKKVEELAYLYGEGHEEKSKKLRIGGLVTMGTAGGLMTVAAAAGGDLAGVLAWLGVTGLIGGAVMGTVAEKRSAKKWFKKVKFWKGKFGEGLFRIAGIGVDTKPDVGVLADRPTEIAVGMAVAGLYEALPPATRESLGDLPAVVKKLEEDAARTRSKVEELKSLIASAETAPPEVADLDLIDRLRAKRDEASYRFSDAMAALETLRIDLLRMRAGSSDTLESLTQDLGSAKQLSDQIARLLEAKDEINSDLNK